MIAIIDYKMGNLGSVEKAVSYLGYETVITNSPDIVRSADGVILPGVGAFEAGMQALEESRMIGTIADFIKTGRPFLGICLGMQLLFESSEETLAETSQQNSECKGLSIIPGRVRRFPKTDGLKIPQIGWNNLIQVKNQIFTENEYMYFVHSYYCDAAEKEDIAAYAEYGIIYPAAIIHGNIYAAQFHPEKSGEAGLAILQRWCGLTKGEHTW